MKKMIKLLFVAIMITVISACSAPKKDDTPKGELQAFEKQIQSPGKLVIGVSPDYPPFESLTATGQLVGFDIDLMNALTDYIKTATGEKYSVEWVQMSFDTIITAVQTGQLDLGMSSFTYEPDREALFSTPYLESQQVVVLNANSKITSLTDLEGKKIGVQLGSTGEGAAKEIAGASLMSLENVGVLFESLKNNAVDAIVVDKAVAENYVKNAGYISLEEPLVNEDVSIIAKKGNDDLMSVINSAIESFKQTEQYQTLLKTWDINVGE